MSRHCVVRTSPTEGVLYRVGVCLGPVSLAYGTCWYTGEGFLLRDLACMVEIPAFPGESDATRYARVELALRPAVAGKSSRYLRRTGLDVASVQSRLREHAGLDRRYDEEPGELRTKRGAA